jgi:hypothetical protein
MTQKPNYRIMAARGKQLQIRRLLRKEGAPNRRGEYPTVGHDTSIYVSKWRRHLTPEGLRRKRPKVDVSHRSYGLRSRKRSREDYGEKFYGFQPVTPHEKPKVPGRVLRDMQSEELWEDEIE